MMYLLFREARIMQIKEFSELTGVSVRTLHYYDELGLLRPASVDKQTGYRHYDETSLLRMQEILFYRELDFPLKAIGEILSAENHDKRQALSDQKRLLTLKKQRLERLISAVDSAMKGENIMNAFDNREYDQYKAEAKERWGDTDAYKEYAHKSKRRSRESSRAILDGMEDVMHEFALCMLDGASPDCASAQTLVKSLQAYITDNFYTCTPAILAGLGQMYVADERFKTNIDRHARGTAKFISEAIRIYCAQAD